MDKFSKLYEKGVSRRNFLVGAGALGAASALAGCTDGTSAGNYPLVSTPGLNDVDILNFALNLEYVEAEFYLYAATGAGLSAADAGPGAGTTIVPAATKIPLTPITATFTKAMQDAQTAVINEIAFDEQQHVRFLRAAITGAGGTPASRPNIDLTFFGPLAMVAGITTVATGSGSFTPFTSFDNFITGAFVFEDVGVTAYLGAAPLISAAGVTAGYLAAASGILAVEAYHAAYLRTAITGGAIAVESTTASTVDPTTMKVTPGVTSTTYAPFNAANKIAALRSALGGGGENVPALTLPNSIPLPVPTQTPTTTTNPVYASSIVNANSSAVAFARTPDQVLHIVYGSATPGVAKGGFLPNGANYRFAQTTS